MKPTLIYVGPTLYGTKIEKRKGEIWKPPASQGDILWDTVKYSPKQIVLIDGRFHQTLSVWVKEIVFSMVDGTKFIGASSMGALRAAELWRYGAIGIGSIFNAYKTGKVTDDAWVAMTYDPATYKPLSLPLCGMKQKQIDALEAIEYSRTNKDKARTTLTRAAVVPLLSAVFDRILDKDLLVYG